MALGWNEIKERAVKFSKEWAGNEWLVPNSPRMEAEFHDAPSFHII